MTTVPELQARFEAYCKQHAFAHSPEGLYAPAAYIMSSPGKRLRPVLSMMGAEMFGGEREAALSVAMAVEVFHNFSLVHDDIMDAAPLRRGKPSVHQAFGLNAGILSGDVMLIYAYKFIAKAGRPETLPRLLGTFNQVAVEVCEGQQYDVDFEARQDVSIPEYIQMIELKTAALIGGALELGAIAAGAEEVKTAPLRDFGRQIGIAFQLQDDILDTFGDPALFGKKVGGDIIQNKKTFLILKALELAQGQEREQLARLMASTPEDEAAKVDTVTSLLRKLGIPDWAEAQKAHYQAQAFDALERVPVAKAYRDALRALSESLMQRQS